MKFQVLVFAFAMMCGVSAFAQIKTQPQEFQQDIDLAQQYFRNSEFEKAVVLYEKLFAKIPTNPTFYQNYLQCLTELKQYDDAEKVIKKQIKKSPLDLTFNVDLGLLYQTEGKTKDAEAEFHSAIDHMISDQGQVSRLANKFQATGLTDEAIETYQKGKHIFNAEDNELYDNELANLYRKKGDPVNTVKYYLDLVQHNPQQVEYVETQLQTFLETKEYSDALQSELFKRLQKYPDNEDLSDMLIWFYVQKKDFASAFLQVKALDKRNHEDGTRMFQFAQTAFEEGNYDAANLAFDYIIKEKGKNGFLYMASRASELTTEKTKITVQNTYTQNDLLQLEAKYESYFTEFGKSPQTMPTVRDYANLEAKYLHNIDTAISILSDAIATGSNDLKLMGYLKLDLGDCYVIKDQVWDAVLLYGQVDKTFKEEPLGEEARFKNAKLSYYIGDFDWSKAQLDILKGSTEELVANDALALSVFITDNTGLDTTFAPMRMYARADLLIFQNQYTEAIKALDSLTVQFPKDPLVDDVLFAKGRIALAQRDFENAALIFTQIDSTFSTDLLGDDALFELAQLYEQCLNNKDKAMDLYKQILLKYKGSIYIIEARKRFRELRGDEVN